MPIGILEVNPAKPHAALSTTPLSGSLANYILLRNSLAESLFRLLRKLFHGELPQIGSPGFMGLIIAQAVAHLNPNGYGTLPAFTGTLLFLVSIMRI